MRNPIETASRSNLRLAFFIVITALLSACAGSGKVSELSSVDCQANVSSIAAIQGTGKSSALQGERHTVRGIVTHIDTASGLYLEQIMADMDPHSSDAVFVISSELPEVVKVGDLLQLSGVVTELDAKNGKGGMTSLAQVTIDGFCGHHQPLPAHAIQLPLSNDERESLEAMRLEITQDLTVTDVYQLYKRRQLNASAFGRLMIPTEISEPGEQAVKLSGKNRQRQITIQLPPDSLNPGTTGATGTIRVGDQIFTLSGVLGQTQGRYLLTATEPIQFSLYKDQGLPGKTTHLRVMGFNLLNYFNGDGKQGGFPTERGAASHTDFIQQRARLVNAIKLSGADIVAVEEMENDGYGPDSAIADLTGALNAAFSGEHWQFSRPISERLGDDVISVGILYQSNRVKTVGPAVSSNAEAFSKLSRRPLAQRFLDLESGGEFLLAINHFKSKGSCPKVVAGSSNPNANNKDGQGCWNQARVEAADAVADWLNSLRNISAVGDMLMLGDFNSYRQEDPIRRLKSRGWTEMVEAFKPSANSSYVYWGQSGTLDYAFASPELKDKVKMAWIWNINSPFSPDHPYSEGGYHRSSDHDPVIVEIDL